MGDKNWEKGYRDGETDQAGGKGKSTFVRPLKRLFKPDQLFPGSQNRFDNYLGGYNTGFEDSVRSFNIRGGASQDVTGNSQGITGSQERSGAMESTQSLSNQLGWCITSRDYLTNLQEEIKHVGRQYYQCIEELRGAEYVNELLRQLHPMMLEFVQLADDVVRHIDSEHLSYINNQAKFVSEKLQQIQSMGGGAGQG